MCEYCKSIFVRKYIDYYFSHFNCSFKRHDYNGFINFNSICYNAFQKQLYIDVSQNAY